MRLRLLSVPMPGSYMVALPRSLIWPIERVRIHFSMTAYSPESHAYSSVEHLKSILQSTGPNRVDMTMNRALRVAGILAFIGVVVFALWAARTRSARRSNQESLNDTIRSAITNPVKFAKARFTGGVGAVLVADPATGVPL